MGPSGSGKTTLLDLLAGRKTTGKVEGSLLFACNKPSSQFLRRYTGYVEQFDTLLPMLTVEEMLMYTAELKRPRKEPLEQKKAAVATILDQLALLPCKNVKIGNSLAKGISGGQAKRTNIGISLITNPRVLFLDEPTSGLDSFTSNEVMMVVKDLVKTNVTIVATIHSPTQYCFSLFDALMMLVRGSVVYHGPRTAALTYIRSLSCTQELQAKEWYNEAELLVDLFTQADRVGQVEPLITAYQESDLKKEVDEAVQALSQDKLELPEQVWRELAVTRATVTPSWWALMTLIKYRTTRNFRDPEFLGPRLLDKVLLGLVMLTLYLGIGNNFSPQNFTNVAAVLFMWVTVPAFSASTYVPSMVLERALFTRERSDGLYRVATYVAAKMFDELTLAGAVSLFVSGIVYAGIQLQGSFLLFFLVYYMTLANGIALAYFFAAISPNMDVANAALPTYATLLLFFSGFLIHFRDIPPWWEWFSYLSFLKYAWSALMVNQFRANDPVWSDNMTVLEYYGVKGDNMWLNLLIMVGLFLATTFGAWGGLTFMKHSRR